MNSRPFVTVTRQGTSTYRKILLASGLAGVTLGVGVGASIIHDPFLISRTKRVSTFWAIMFPIYAHYRVTEWWFSITKSSPTQQEQAYDSLHNIYAPVILRLILNLRGLFIKIGQVGAMRGDIVPDVYQKQLAQLFDKVPALSGKEAREIAEKALGRPLEEVFESFDDEVLGSASIGQVHRAVLRKSHCPKDIPSRTVAVKIKYPEAEGLFKQDLEIAKQFARLAQPEHVPTLNELQKQFLGEFDFEREAWAMDYIGKSLHNEFSSRVRVPRPILPLCKKDIIVMEFLPGSKLGNVVKEVAEELGLSIQEMMEMVRGSSRWKLWTGALLKRIVDSVKYDAVFVWNWTFGLLGYQKEYPEPSKIALINSEKLLQTLFEVHGHQIFNDGLFNGDPHHGNILLLPDGKIGLIDYGQVKSLSRKEKRSLARFIVALAEDDKEEIVRLARGMGYETQKNDPYVIYKSSVVGFDRDGPEVCEGDSSLFCSLNL
eukprot:TRINITY_DN1675_c0_g1_i2.p1 TRINITY_DN1675_c0_g1~~TRINITY_DN1675_c0_g1_i2.p1  ORF type:complete len:507 (-),score=90.32 TRINITY_DN1675_c0_g1_i2:276-1736(-)